jgi:hypothetical protein
MIKIVVENYMRKLDKPESIDLDAIQLRLAELTNNQVSEGALKEGEIYLKFLNFL